MRNLNHNITILKLLTFVFFVTQFIFAQNPISPPGVYIADPSAKVWNNGKLYIYGSLDENCEYYCSHKHHLLFTDDMVNWQLTKDIFASKGQGDEVLYNDKVLYAPDAIFKNGTYYLYYCQPDKNVSEGVATAKDPAGPFTGGTKIDLNVYNQIDPAVFTDDDGQSYYLWGQFSLKMAKMKSNMKELELATIKDSVLTEKKHHFHEGGFLTKRNGIYYLVFADISRGDVPSSIGYATSNSVFGPYKYGGVIIDNNYCNPGNWNNHGSIAAFKDKWYVFYHRSTQGCNTMRKACVEPILFRADGSIPEVEMTSQGAGKPLNPTSIIEAEWACVLHGNIRIMPKDGNNDMLDKIYNSDKVVYKYVDFGQGVDSISFNFSKVNEGGKIVVSLDKPWHKQLGVIDINANTSNILNKKWYKVQNARGIHALWLSFYGSDSNMFSIDSFSFK